MDKNKNKTLRVGDSQPLIRITKEGENIWFG